MRNYDRIIILYTHDENCQKNVRIQHFRLINLIFMNASVMFSCKYNRKFR